MNLLNPLLDNQSKYSRNQPITNHTEIFSFLQTNIMITRERKVNAVKTYGLSIYHVDENKLRTSES